MKRRCVVLASRDTREFQDDVNALVDRASALDFTAIDALRRETERQLTLLYWEKADAVAREFFASCRDILVAHLFSRLPLTTLLTLRLLSHQWYRMVCQCEHLTLTGRHYLQGGDWEGVAPFIMRRFTKVHSVCLTRDMFDCNYIGGLFERLTALEFVERDSHKMTATEPPLSVAHLTNLRSLVVRCKSVVLSDVAQLTALTRLEVLDKSVEDPRDIESLTSLTELTTRGITQPLVLTRLTRLAWLQSDNHWLFVNYTGRGVLDTDDFEEPTGRVLSQFGAECNDCWANGQWDSTDGFTGDVVLCLCAPNDNETTYRGGYARGKREGAGTVRDTANRRLCEGTWRDGLLHGPSATYTWREVLYFSANERVLLERAVWHHGTLLECVKVPNDIAGTLEQEEASARALSDVRCEVWVNQATFLTSNVDTGD